MKRLTVRGHARSAWCKKALHPDRKEHRGACYKAKWHCSSFPIKWTLNECTSSHMPASLTTSCLAPAGLPTVGYRKWPCFLIRIWLIQSRTASKTATGVAEPKTGIVLEVAQCFFLLIFVVLFLHKLCVHHKAGFKWAAEHMKFFINGHNFSMVVASFGRFTL